MKALLTMIFTWWKGPTFGTFLYTYRKGIKVGSDSFGNVYYTNKDKTERWVIYKYEAEPTTVPADWHGWLHFTFDNNPENDPLPTHSWEQPFTPNLTGTQNAYKPAGSLLNDASHKPTNRYESFNPNQPQ